MLKTLLSVCVQLQSSPNVSCLIYEQYSAFRSKERIKTCSNSFQAFGMLNGRDLQKKINLLRF